MRVVAFWGLFARLMKDTRGNALILMGASLIPLVAAIGCGMDYARASMARSKLQQAVDAAALAGRRAMTADNIETAKPDITAYLAFNFPTGIYGTTPLSSAVTKPDIGEVRVEANSTVPMTMMKLFGIAALPIKAAGVATQNFENIDIMLVLDTTGSMNDAIKNVKKIEALKTAVVALYTQLYPAQQQLERQNLRMRYGIVPYSSTVNVGGLLTARNLTYIQSKNVSYYHRYKKSGSSSPVFGLQNYDLTKYVGGAALGDINGYGSSSEKWAGCIEERKTDGGITAKDSRDGAPVTAYDLDIDLIPNSGNSDTQWKPFIYDVSSGPNSDCPTQSVALVRMTQSQLQAQANKLIPDGTTYHDIGMIWGVRMISNAGIFGSENPDTWNQQKVRRYVIFMTDGLMNAPMGSGSDFTAYSAYGIEAYDHRVGGTSDTDNRDRHTKRFMMACNAAKAKGVSIWTIAFGTGRDANLDACASSLDQSSVASDSTALIDKFTQIGKQIGPLRISH